MKSSTPYLIRAMLEWILDSKCTPYLIVDARVDKVRVPPEQIEDGEVVLDISPKIAAKLVITPDYILYTGQYPEDVEYDIVVPISAVTGIIARENGQGMWFTSEGPEPEPPVRQSSAKPVRPPAGKASSKTGPKTGRSPTLRIVK